MNNSMVLNFREKANYKKCISLIALMKTIQDLNEKYDLELEKVIFKIKSEKAKLVLLQFPDGLKPYATAVVDYLEQEVNSCTESPRRGRHKEKTNVQFLIWLGDCFGACDTPILGKELEKKIDLVVQFGHNELMPRRQ